MKHLGLIEDSRIPRHLQVEDISVTLGDVVGPCLVDVSRLRWLEPGTVALSDLHTSLEGLLESTRVLSDLGILQVHRRDVVDRLREVVPRVCGKVLDERAVGLIERDARVELEGHRYLPLRRSATSADPAVVWMAICAVGIVGATCRTLSDGLL